jgi:hypothetical protein
MYRARSNPGLLWLLLGLLTTSLSSLVEHLDLFGSSMRFVLGFLDGFSVVAFAVGIFVASRYIRSI